MKMSTPQEHSMTYLDFNAVTQLWIKQSLRVNTVSQILTLAPRVAVPHILSTGTSAKGKCC